MLLKRFYTNLIVRLALILGNLVLIAFAVRDLIASQHLFTLIVLTGILVLQVSLLFLYIRRANRQLTRLILSVSNQDFSQTLIEKGTPYKGLQKALGGIIEKYRTVYMEREGQNYLMQHLVQSMPVGVILIDPGGKFELINGAMEDLLELSATKSVEEFRKAQPALYRQVMEYPGPGSHTLVSTVKGEQKKLSVNLREFILMNRPYRILLVQDISREVEAGEVDAIQRLLRVLTHEIMNSLTPVQTLAETIFMLMEEAGESGSGSARIGREPYDDIMESVRAIQERVGNLDQFVGRFRKLTRMPEHLDLRRLKVAVLFKSVTRIMQTELKSCKLEIELERDDLEIMADKALMEQVMINLIANALAAMTGTAQPRLVLKAFAGESLILVQVIDNGTGIPREKQNDIFMPFYSTKKEASGIGLSFVKQVLRLHFASIRVQSEPGKGSTFSLAFESGTDAADRALE